MYAAVVTMKPSGWKRVTYASVASTASHAPPRGGPIGVLAGDGLRLLVQLRVGSRAESVSENPHGEHGEQSRQCNRERSGPWLSVSPRNPEGDDTVRDRDRQQKAARDDVRVGGPPPRRSPQAIHLETGAFASSRGCVTMSSKKGPGW